MAEALLRARLAEQAPQVTVGSAGLYFDGRPAERGAVKAMARLGHDLTPFRSRTLTPELIEGASLILGMERLHVRAVYDLVPDRFARCFTLIEFVEGAEVFGPRQDEDLGSWVERIGRLRSPTDYAGPDPTSEVADPMGGSGRVFRAVADQLRELTDRLADLAWPAGVGATPPVSSSPPLLGGP